MRAQPRLTAIWLCEICCCLVQPRRSLRVSVPRHLSRPTMVRRPSRSTSAVAEPRAVVLSDFRPRKMAGIVLAPMSPRIQPRCSPANRLALGLRRLCRLANLRRQAWRTLGLPAISWPSVASHGKACPLSHTPISNKNALPAPYPHQSDDQ